MKNLTKIFMAVAAGMLAFSCVTDATNDLAPELGLGVAGQTELTLSLEESRTQLGEKVGDTYPLYWSENDQVSVNGTAYTVVIDSNNKALAVLSNVAEAETYCIAYPATDAGKVHFAEVQNHVAEGNTFESGVSTMYAYSESGLGVQLKHLTGVLKFGITGNAVLSKLQVSTINRDAIAGDFEFDFANGELTKATASAKNTIEYSFGEAGLQLSETPQYVHIAVPAGLNGGLYDELYVTLYEQGDSGNIMYATIKAGDSKPLVAGNVREFNNAIPYTPNAKLFVINSVEKLQAFKAAIEAEGGLASDAIITEDIDMTGVEWTPIVGENYTHTLLGNGYAIKGLTAPLFATTSASFKGVHLEDVNITSGAMAQCGALAGNLTATDTISPKVENCSVSGTIIIEATDEEVHYVRHGCLVGCANGVAFDGCVNNANITCTKPFLSGKYDICLGGIVGWLCEFTKSDASLVYGTLNNCTNNGKISMENNTSTIATLYIGGLCGSSKDANQSVSLNNNTNNGEVSALANCGSIRMAGVSGFAHGPAKESHETCNKSVNNGTIIVKAGTTSSGENYIGGIVGNSKDLSYTYCHNYGAITLEEGSTLYAMEVGGIVARSLSDGDASDTNLQHYCTNNAPLNVGSSSTTQSGDAVFRVGGITAYTQGDIRYCTNNKEGVITVSGNRNTNGKHGNGTSPRIGTYCVAGICGYKTVDTMSDCTNHGDIIMSGTITEKTNTISEVKVAGIVCYTSKDGANFVSDGTIKLTGTFGCEMQVAGSIGFHYNTISGEEKSSTKIEISGDCSKGLVVGGVVGQTYVKVEDLEYNGSINITKDAVIGTTCYIGGGVGKLMTSLKNGTTGHSSPSGVYCKDVTNKGSITVNGTIDCTPYIGGCVGYAMVGRDGATYYALSNLTNNAAITLGDDGNVPNTELYIAGCVGHAEGSVTTATNSGAITVSGSSTGGKLYIAGCVGDAEGSVTTATNSGEITASGSSTGDNLYIAGCVGHAEGNVTTATNSGAITVSGSSTGGNSYIAGCVADAGISYTLSGLTNEAAILCDGTVKSARLGGVGGYVGIIENSLNTGSVTFTGTATSESHCCGISYYSTTMKGCVNGSETDPEKGKLEYNTQNGKAVYFAGLARQCITRAENCTNYGNMYLNNTANGTIYIGGLIATGVDNATYVSEREGCHNYGNIYVNADVAPTANNNCFVGGFTYRNNNAYSFKDCHNHGNIILKEGITIGNSIRMGGCIGTMETNKNVTFDNCSNSGNIIVPSTVTCGNTTANTTGYIRVGGIVGNQSSGTITVKNTIKNSGTINVAGECKHNQNLSIGGVFAYTKTAFTADSEAVIINEGEVIFGAKSKKGLRVGGVIGAVDATHPATVSFINTGNISCTGTFASDGAYIGGVFGNTAASQANAQCFCDIKADAETYTGVGHITGSHRSETVKATNCKVGGYTWVYNKRTGSYEQESIPEDTYFNYIYGSGEGTDWAGTDNYDGCSWLEKKADIVVPTISAPESGEDNEGTETPATPEA